MSDMHTYRLGIRGIEETLSAGTSLMVIGPAMSGKDSILDSIVAEGLGTGEAVILISTMETGESAVGRFKSAAGLEHTQRLAVIDCMSRQLGLSVADTPGIKRVSGPMDLTGMGVRASQFLDEFRAKGLKVRLCVNSLSTLLMYSSLQAVFRFLHVLAGRVSIVGALGAYLVEEGMHEARALSTLKQLCSAVIEVKAENGRLFLRLMGSGVSRRDWREFGIVRGMAVIRGSTYDQ